MNDIILNKLNGYLDRLSKMDSAEFMSIRNNKNMAGIENIDNSFYQASYTIVLGADTNTAVLNTKYAITEMYGYSNHSSYDIFNKYLNNGNTESIAA